MCVCMSSPCATIMSPSTCRTGPPDSRSLNDERPTLVLAYIPPSVAAAGGQQMMGWSVVVLNARQTSGVFRMVDLY